jgi:hypothetical protein
MAGCDAAPRETATTHRAPATSAKAATLVRPDAFRISYDADRRLLTLYDLPDDQARWMLSTPRNAKGEPVTSGHVFASEVDLDRVTVFYTTKGVASPAISLREVLTLHVSSKP